MRGNASPERRRGAPPSRYIIPRASIFSRWRVDLRETVLILVFLGCAALAQTARAYDWSSYNVEDFEESAGAIGCFEINPADDIYGVSVGDGTWLTGTPVFGDFFLPFFYNGIEDAVYAGAGMTLRIMPHWKYAPFAGAGASYNLSLSGTDDSDFSENPKGESYWGGHAESGIRIQTQTGSYEIMGRFTWSSSEIEDADYWIIRVGWGSGF